MKNSTSWLLSGTAAILIIALNWFVRGILATIAYGIIEKPFNLPPFTFWEILFVVNAIRTILWTNVKKGNEEN